MGSLLGSWGTAVSLRHVAIGPADTLFGIGEGVWLVYHYTLGGSLIASWGAGFVNSNTYGIDADADGTVFISNYSNGTVHYFTSTGSHIGSVLNSFYHALDVALSNNGDRLYVGANGQNIYYFRRTETRVAPASLGKVKALFR